MNRFSLLIKHIKNERGSSLVLVLLVIMMFTILGVSLMGLQLNSAKMNASERNDQSTYYIAEAGIVKSMSEIESKLENIQAKSENEFYLETERIFSELQPPIFEKNFGNQPEAIVTVKKGAEKGDYSLVSEGIIGNKKRTLVKDFKVEWNGGDYEEDGNDGGEIEIPENLAIFVSEGMTLAGAQIKGDAYANVERNSSIYYDWGTNISNGAFYVPSSYEREAIKAPPNRGVLPQAKSIDHHISFTLPPFPTVFPNYPLATDVKLNNLDVIKNGKLTFYTNVNKFVLQLKENLSFTEIKITENATMTIDVGDSDKVIVVDHLNIPTGHIKIIGDGKLTIYIKDKITLGSGSTINKGRSFNKLDMYLKGSGNINQPKILQYGNDEKIYGSIYAEDATMTIGGSGGFQGHILTGGKMVEITGDASGNPAFIYAPHAEIIIGGSGKVSGSIIGKSLKTTGNIYITYQPFDTVNLPFFPVHPEGRQEAGGVVIGAEGIHEK